MLEVVVGCGELTFWLLISVTMPLELTRAMMLRPTPVLWLLTVLVNREFPPSCTPPATAWELSVGTDSPTWICAGMLSVATTVGAEITRARVVCSCAVSSASSSRLWPTSIPAESCNTPPAVVPNNWRLRGTPVELEELPLPLPVPPDPLAPLPANGWPTFCKYASTPPWNAPVRSTS